MATLDFKGKGLVQNYHLTVKYHELVPKKDKSLTDKVRLDDNLIIHGDNLKALKALLPTYAGRVKCIYIDPPYNTGSEGWAYNDNVNSPMMQEWLGKVVDSDDLTRHDKWLCMMMPRLKLLKELLSNDGVIFASIDDHESANLKKLMEEVFGEENFIDTIAVEMSTTSGPKTVNAQQGTIVKNVEFVHVYQKSAEFDKKPHIPLLDGIEYYDTHYSIWLNDDGTLGTLAEKLLGDKKIKDEIKGLWQNLWLTMAHSDSRQASPLRVAPGGDASWRLEARRRRSPACCRNAWSPSAVTSVWSLSAIITM
jgi:adenine-specific DNA-methyltransferase